MSGAQPLYHVAYEFVPNAELTLPISSTTVQRFGIRQITTQLDKYSMRPDGVMMQVFVNHKPIMIKGGGYTPTDIYMRQNILYGNAPTHHALVDLMKSMGFNAMRDEGKFFSDDLYDIMDEEGLFLIPGYMCCDRHEINGLQHYATVERFILYEQTYSQIRRIRHRPSMLMWMNGSDYTKERTGAT
jgi:exo-1,4-beta-D-glucosaminidase